MSTAETRSTMGGDPPFPPPQAASDVVAEDRDTITRRVLRGERPVLLRTPREARPSPDVMARLRYGAATSQALDLPGVTRVLGIEEGEGGLGVVLEDFGGQTLASLLAEGRLEITEAVRVATQVARTLGALHARRVVHKGVDPSSILLNPETGEVKLTNFDAASRQGREEPALAGPHRAAAPAYLAPEQTGRTSRAVDYRADLYALGVTLYEMLTGQTPAASGAGGDTATDAAGPVPPERLRPSVPSALSEVVLKLLAPNAEDRYQSAEGLVSDLNECLGHLVDGATLADFQLGRNDVTTTFLLPQLLYGREAPREALLAAFVRATRGPSELVVVSGPAGVGKTALVHELRAAAGRERVRFCSGSGDPVRAHPYGALGQAFGELCTEILAQGDAIAAAFRQRLLAAVGPAVQLVADVVPGLARLVGPCPPVPRLGPAEARDRFDLAFQETASAFAGREHPLVLFLDDLQWIDEASLRMVEILLRDPGGRHLLVIGATSGAPEPGVERMIAGVRAGPSAVTEVALGPLGADDVGRFVADALSCPPEDPPRELAALVAKTTGGNPLFAHQLLGWLHQCGLLRLDAGSGRWQCNVERLRGGSLASDPSALFDARIGMLPSASARAIAIAACFGRRFDLGTQARASAASRREAAADLWPAVEAELLHPIGGAHRCAVGDPPGDVEYAFVHPAAHAAALGRISPELRRELRRRAAQQLLAEATPEERRAAAFDLADQLQPEPGASLPLEARIQLAEIDLVAGERASACNAFAAALRHLAAGISLLPEDAWSKDHALAFALHRDHALAAFLEGHFADAEAELELVRDRAADDGVRLSIDILLLVLANGRGDFPGAVRLGRAALARVGITFPEREDAAAALAAEIAAVEAMVGARPVDALLDAPVTTDAAERGRVELLAHTLIAAAQGDVVRFRAMGAMIVHRSLRYGLAPFSSLGYGAYGVVAGRRPGIHADAPGAPRLELSRLALPLSRRLDSPGTQAVVQSFGAIFTSPLRRPLRDSLPPLEEAHAGALAAGDLRLAGHAAVQRLLLGLMSGEDLYRLQDRAGKYLALLQRLGRTLPAALTASVLRTLLLLTRGPAPPAAGPMSGPRSTIPDGFVGLREDVEQPAVTGETGSFASHWVLALQRAFLFSDRRRALEYAAEAGARLASVDGHPVEAEYRYYHALALAAAGAPPPGDEPPLRTIEAHRDRLAVWAEGSPDSFRHRHLLVAAEAARLGGNEMVALELYDRAIEAAAAHHHPGGEAIAAELASRFHLSAGRPHVARAYLLHARQAYARWGADGKVADLTHRHADLLPAAVAASPALAAGAPADLAAVIHASQAIGAELDPDALQDLVLRLSLELAGASRAVLVRDVDGDVLVEALLGGESPAVRAPRPPSPDESEDVPRSILRHVEKTGEGVALEHAAADGPFRSDPYVIRARPRSVLCLPLRRAGDPRTVGLLYLENNLAAGVFTAERHAAMATFAAQAAVALENARAHGELVRRVRAQETEIERSHRDLASALARVKDAQKRLLVQEKLATLGGLTAGIAHEIKNPLNFINNFAESSVGIADELSEELRGQRAALDPDALVNLEDLLGELRGNAAKIHEHGRRADDIVRSMLEHSRGGSATARAVDLNALLKEYVTLAYQGFRSQDSSFNTSIEQSYAQGLAPMSLVPQDMGRVFLNLINNACYAVHAKKKAVGRAFAPTLRVSTRDLGHAVQIRIRDNGTGIPAEVRQRMFEPFFTTKPTGDGTGLGLPISVDIVQEQGGTLEVETEEGEFTEFVITLPRKAPAG